VVERSVRDAGFACYVPRLRREICHHRSKQIITRSFPLFTGYAFVGDPCGAYEAVRACDGVARFLGQDGCPWPVDGRAVAAIQAAEHAMAFDDTREARIRRRQEGRSQRETIAMRFPAGAAVTVLKGPFAGFNGHVESVEGRGIIKAAIEVFKRLTPIEFEASALQLAA
jgi:transcription antitermination factor NusG